MKKICLLLWLCCSLTGCLSYQAYTFRFDYNTGIAEKEYYDIRTQKGGDEDYSAEKDWALLKSRAGEEFGKEFDPEVIKPVRAELFQDGDVLSGKEIFAVQAPKAFPSKTAVLERLHADDDLGLEFLVIQGEIFLFSSNKNISSSTGRKILTEKNGLIVWPEEALVFDFSLPAEQSGGTSLLPFLQAEKEDPQTDRP